jgi:hypothetical protein
LKIIEPKAAKRKISELKSDAFESERLNSGIREL